MKNNRVTQTLRKHRKLLLAVMLLAVAFVLSSCYVEPDRTVDDTDGLTIGTEGQDFETVITPDARTQRQRRRRPRPPSRLTGRTGISPADTATNQPSSGVHRPRLLPARRPQTHPRATGTTAPTAYAHQGDHHDHR